MKHIIRIAAVCIVVFSYNIAQAVVMDLKVRYEPVMVKAKFGPLETITEVDNVIMHLYDSLEECNEEIADAEPLWDIDKDGIPDRIERSVVWQAVGSGFAWVHDPINESCDCNGRLSCWTHHDTDGDGVADGQEMSEHAWWYDLLLMDGTEPVEERIVYPVYSDDDDLPDVRDADSDDDGLMDGEEDRSKYYSAEDENIFMELDLGYFIYMMPYLNFKDETVGCDLEDKEDIGVRYGYYIIKRFGSVFFEGTLACTNNSSLGSDVSWNGEFDGIMDTSDFRNPDTDGDGFCDGEGIGCDGMPLDLCPQEYAPDSTDGCL